MVLGALRQRVLLHRHFGVPMARARRAVQAKPIRYPTLALRYYVSGLRALFGVLREAVDVTLLPVLPGLLAQHAQQRPTLPRLDGALRKIAIVGPPRAGKTTYAVERGALLGLDVHHADDLIDLGWSEASAELAKRMTAARSGVFEGVAVVRALRKMLAAYPGKPVDRVYLLSQPHVQLTAAQQRMATGHATIWREVAPELSRRGVELVFDPPTQAPAHGSRMDAVGDEVDAVFARLAEYYRRRVTASVVSTLVEQSAERASNTNRGEVERQIKQVLPIDVHVPDTGVAAHLDAFVAQNVRAVQGLTDSAIDKLHAIVLESARDGLRYDAAAKRIREQLQVSQRRATNLARDQLGTLNAELTEIRQTSLGIARYRWVTSHDERVRKSHRALDGTIQQWAKPPIENPRTGARAHPGKARKCRCGAVAVVEDLLVDAGLIDEGEAPPRRRTA